MITDRGEDRKVALEGASLSYRVTGSQTGTESALVLLHPWFGCRQFWDHTVTDFGDRRCYAVDFYSLAAGDWTGWAGPEQLAKAVLAMMDHEHLERVDLVGNSVGGIVAQILAAAHPGRVRRLVLVGTGARTSGVHPTFAQAVDTWIAAADKGTTPPRETAETTIAMLFSTDPDEPTRQTFTDAVMETDPAFIAAVLTSARHLDLTDRLHRITAPTLVLRGTEDRARTAEHAARLAAGIPQARWQEIPEAGHSPMVDHPAEFSRLTSAHLS
ncbi:alpha/beta fold hydrolase [Rhodococcus wratislaviensis]|uniref:Putative hydrolase n=1 Tax=Rhodococcus wratislaviensis NBRC 100605 TaxID=1219028 RepID=X0Q9M9_RHOWR|nr:alpha/beta fold hydrolase [Rhodococcus wratislaviensis]GAF48297.1 putative hydrolase [Rhodococcus wratislaviensis NBRC 100605]